MVNLKKKLMILFSSLSIGASLFSCSSNYNYIYESIEDGYFIYTKLSYQNAYSIRLNKEVDYPLEITIPSKFKGVPVTTIETSAFLHSAIESVTIPNSVTSIGAAAFFGCNSLTAISIPDSVSYVGESAFHSGTLQYNKYKNGYYLGNEKNPYVVLMKIDRWEDIVINENTKILYDRSLAFYMPNPDTYNGEVTINIPSSVVNIGSDVLGLSFEIYYNIKFNEYKGGYYIGNRKNPYMILMKPKDKNINKFTINNRTRFIYDYAFIGCEELKSINIPKSVMGIGDDAFAYCSSLVSINIPNGVKSIGAGAFANCTSLKEVEISSSLKTINGKTFYYCTSLRNVKFENKCQVEIINNLAFANCKSLVSINIPKSVTIIGSVSFIDCSSLVSIIIPKSVRNIYSGPFDGCESLTIFCETESKPDGWIGGWNYTSDYVNKKDIPIPTYWKGEWSYVNGVPTPNK